MGRIRIVEDNESAFGRRVRVVFDETNIVDIEELKDGSVAVKLSHQKNEVVLNVTPSGKNYSDTIDKMKSILTPQPSRKPPTRHAAATLQSLLGNGTPHQKMRAKPQSRAMDKRADLS